MGDFYEAFAQPWTRVPEGARGYNEALAREGQQPGTVALDSFGPPIEVDAYEALVRDPSASLRRLADRAARALAPGLYSYLAERAPPPPPPNADLYSPGKMPIDRDPQLEGAWGDAANITSNFVGPGGPIRAGATAAAAGLPFAALRVARLTDLPADIAKRVARGQEMGWLFNMPLLPRLRRGIQRFPKRSHQLKGIGCTGSIDGARPSACERVCDAELD